ncbi:hypothetical protein JCM19233_5524 [Vibrio astriarenae]|nr:hypothetical protein JCM19233_5524 [Vibrio sp. C7]
MQVWSLIAPVKEIVPSAALAFDITPIVAAIVIGNSLLFILIPK